MKHPKTTRLTADGQVDRGALMRLARRVEWDLRESAIGLIDRRWALAQGLRTAWAVARAEQQALDHGLVPVALY